MLSVLQQVYTNIKSYRTALYSYRINLLNSLGTMSNRLIPMSLVPKNDLQGILQALTSSPKIQANNLMLALNPITEVNAYYETRLLQEVYADEVGLIFKVSMPMATKPQSCWFTEQSPSQCQKAEQRDVHNLENRRKLLSIDNKWWKACRPEQTATRWLRRIDHNRHLPQWLFVEPKCWFMSVFFNAGGSDDCPKGLWDWKLSTPSNRTEPQT